MSYQALGDKIVKTRRPHTCFGCGTKYLPKSIMKKVDGIYEGSIQHLYYCKICTNFMKIKNVWEDNEEMDSGAFWEWGEYKIFRKSQLKEEYGTT